MLYFKTDQDSSKTGGILFSRKMLYIRNTVRKLRMTLGSRVAKLQFGKRGRPLQGEFNDPARVKQFTKGV